MPSKCLLSKVRGEIKRDGEWSREQRLSKEVSPVKFVGGIFLHPDGSPDAWAEIVLGNDTDCPVKITEIEIRIQEGEPDDAIDPNIKRAPSGFDTRETDGPGYLWGEEETGWESMYEEYRRLEEGDGFFETGHRDVVPDDKIHTYELGSGDTEQCVVSTPVEYNSPTRTGIEDGFHIFTIRNLKTLVTGEEPVIYPKNVVEDEVASVVEHEYREYVDCTSIWVKWDALDFQDYKQEGRFTTQFVFESQIGDVNHYYGYYTLPPNLVFELSNSPAEVKSWGPAKARKMFQEWADRYGIDSVSAGGSESVSGVTEAGDMYRSRVRSTNEVKNGFRYEIPSRKSAEQGLERAANLFLAVFGSVTISLLLRNFSVESGLLALVVLLGCIVALLWINLTSRVTGSISRYLESI